MKKALIVHVGNKYSRAVKSIEYIKPDVVYFIYNGDYDRYIKLIQDETDLIYEVRPRMIEDFQSIDEVYSKSREIFKEIKKEEYEIHVGVSNGTKAMVAGLSLASVGYDCNFL